MNTAATPRPRSLPPYILIAALALLTGCAAMDKAAQETQAYNIQQCQAYGLQPGTDQYVQCVSQGPNAYAAARANAANAAAQAPPAGTIAVLPIGIGIPITPAPPAQNNACSAPKSSPQGSCPGCSVSCGAKQASCNPGSEIPGGSSICITAASCTCQ
jgi:hypothetical protein